MGTGAGESSGRAGGQQSLSFAISRLSPDDQADFNERAAIHEYEGGLSRAESERRALNSTLERIRKRRRA